MQVPRVGDREDVAGGEVGDEITPFKSPHSPSSHRRQSTQSPSSWQKVDREPALPPTNLINRDAEAAAGGGGGGGGGGGVGGAGT